MSGNVVDLIKQDHREFKRMFSELSSSRDTRAAVLPVFTTLLMAHSRAEEAEVYPAARDEAGATHDVEHSQEEHIEADQLLEVLAATDPFSDEFEPALAAVVESVTHHLEEEETSVLVDLAKNLTEDRLQELGERFLAVRAEHLGQQPGELTKGELEQQASNVDLAGASSMSKDELETALEEKAAQSG
jgi:hemerythrin-like domain-containing protein